MGSEFAALKVASSSCVVFLTTDVAVDPRPNLVPNELEAAVLLGCAYFEAPIGNMLFLFLVVLAVPLVRVEVVLGLGNGWASSSVLDRFSAGGSSPSGEEEGPLELGSAGGVAFFLFP